MKNLRVRNILGNNGREVTNQFVISYTDGNGNYIEIFQSYDSMIVKKENGGIVEVGNDWNYSNTTGKYRNIFTGMERKAFEKMLKEEFEWNEETQTYKRK